MSVLNAPLPPPPQLLPPLFHCIMKSSNTEHSLPSPHADRCIFAQRLRTFLRNSLAIGLVGFSMPSLVSQAGTVSVEIVPFQKPGALLEDFQFRFLETVRSPSALVESTTHLILEGLYAVEGEENTFSSAYSAVDPQSGAVGDAGLVLMNLPPPQIPEGSVVSPVVGVVHRGASWEEHNPEPVPTTVGGASGEASYDPEAGTITFNLQRGAQSFQGTTTYSFDSAEVLQIPSFVIANGESHLFSGASLPRTEHHLWEGLLDADPEEDLPVDSQLFVLRITAVVDSNGNGIPDFLEGVATGPAPWHLQSVRVEPYSSGGGVYQSPWFGTYISWSDTHDSGYILHYEHGYLFVVGTGGENLFAWDDGRGWFWINGSAYPFLYEFTDTSWLYYYPGTGSFTTQRVFWHFQPPSGSPKWVFYNPSGIQL